jgi:hypothetical protein
MSRSTIQALQIPSSSQGMLFEPLLWRQVAEYVELTSLSQWYIFVVWCLIKHKGNFPFSWDHIHHRYDPGFTGSIFRLSE